MAAVAGRLARTASGVRTLFSLPFSSFSLASVVLVVQVPSTTNYLFVELVRGEGNVVWQQVRGAFMNTKKPTQQKGEEERPRNEALEEIAMRRVEG